MQEIIVAATEAGQRLDKMLAKYLNEAPKSFLYKMLRKKNIVLNGKKATGNEKLAVGDSVKLFLADETIAKFSNIHAVHTNVTLDIIYEDENVLLINKPVGMLSQKAAADDESLVEHIISYMLETRQRKNLENSDRLSATVWTAIRVDWWQQGKVLQGCRRWEHFLKIVL